MNILAIIILSVICGVAAAIANIVGWFLISKWDRDPTTGGAYVAVGMLTSPVAFLIGFIIGFLVMR